MFLLCSMCGETKPQEAFNRRSDTPRGFHSRCKGCLSKVRHKRYQDDPAFRERALARSRDPQQREKALRRKQTPKGKATQRNSELLRKFGISNVDFDQILLSQGGRCAICSTDKPGGKGNRFHVDHDHDTGKVRALLCSNCNRGLGHFQENIALLEVAIMYLRTHQSGSSSTSQ